jgi:hypothetical protein
MDVISMFAELDTESVKALAGTNAKNLEDNTAFIASTVVAAPAGAVKSSLTVVEEDARDATESEARVVASTTTVKLLPSSPATKDAAGIVSFQVNTRFPADATGADTTTEERAVPLLRLVRVSPYGEEADGNVIGSAYEAWTVMTRSLPAPPRDTRDPVKRLLPAAIGTLRASKVTAVTATAEK